MQTDVRRWCVMALLATVGALRASAQMTAPKADSLDVDTLREVTVRGRDRTVRMPMSNSLRQDVNLQTWSDRYSLGGLLQQVAPTLHDQIMHPFGFAERKKNRKRKKVARVLEQYDAIDQRDPLQLLLDSVARSQGLLK